MDPLESPHGIPADTRGIIDPATMVRHVDFERFPAPPELEGLVDWFWSVRWDLRLGFVHRQAVVAQPGVNISVGVAPPPGPHPPPGPYPLRIVVNGVPTRLGVRTLTGRGWNLAAKTTTGGFGAWVDDAKALTDRVLPAEQLLGLDADVLARSCAEVPPAEGAARLGAALAELLVARDPERIALARVVARVATIAERDRRIRRVEQLAELAAVTPRTLQRMFASCAGVGPTWVIRRARLLDAAELVRDGSNVDWAAVATELGYADQAHLTRDFTRTIGRSPAAYARECRGA